MTNKTMTNKYSLMLVAALALITSGCTISQSPGMARGVTFAPNDAAIPASEQHKIADIAQHMHNNPTQRASMDNRAEQERGMPRTKNLSDHRQDAIRAALVDAGVANSRITSFWHDEVNTN